MNQIIGFLRLQNIDTRLDQVNSRIKQINILLQENDEIKKLSKHKDEINQRIASSSKQLAQSEESVQAQHVKNQQIEARLYSGNVKNPKELQELQAEIISLKKYYSSLENHQLQIMLSIEAEQKEYDLIITKLAEVEQLYLSKNNVLQEEKGLLLSELDRLTAEKKAAEISIKYDDLFFYNKLRLQRGGVAVSTLSEGACDSCGATLTPSQLQAVKSQEQIFCCPSCGRMLYAP